VAVSLVQVSDDFFGVLFENRQHLLKGNHGLVLAQARLLVEGILVQEPEEDDDVIVHYPVHPVFVGLLGILSCPG